MNKTQAEDYIYCSYLKAQPFLRFEEPDSMKRHPELTKDLLKRMSIKPSAVVTGSKGKGSVAAMAASIISCKLKTGLFTSPHISDFRERFRIFSRNQNIGTLINENDFISYINKIRPEFEALDASLSQGRFISPIGIQAALALSWFNENATDFNILECGKGAKYDDVNNVPHKYALINTIFLEHKRELGKTIEEIAEDKSHVITTDVKTVFCGPQHPDVLKIIENRAARMGSVLKVYGRDFWCEGVDYTIAGMKFDIVTERERFPGIEIPLLGEHQAKNCALAFALALDIFKEEGIHVNTCSEGTQTAQSISLEEIKQRLKNLEWPGRMQILSSHPFVMLDACINGASAEKVKETLKFLGIEKATVIIGIPDDKDFLSVAKVMAEISDKIFLTKSQNPHYVFTPAQVGSLAGEGIKAEWSESFQEAFEEAWKRELPIVILGTTSLVSEVLTAYSKGEWKPGGESAHII